MTEAETALDQATLALSAAINAWGKALLAHQAEVLARVTADSSAPAMPAAAPSVMAGRDPATHPVPVEAAAPACQPDTAVGQPDQAECQPDPPAALGERPAPQRRGITQRTPARRVRLLALMDETPRKSGREITAILNGIQPGAPIPEQSVWSWMTEIKRNRGDVLAAAPARPSTPAPRDMAEAMAEIVQVGPREYARLVGERFAAAPSPPPPQSNYPKISGSSDGIAATPPTPLPVPSGTIKANDSQIRDWAAQRGMIQGRTLDLRAINAKRADLGLPPFAEPAERKPFRLGATA